MTEIKEYFVELIKIEDKYNGKFLKNCKDSYTELKDSLPDLSKKNVIKITVEIREGKKIYKAVKVICNSEQQDQQTVSTNNLNTQPVSTETNNLNTQKEESYTKEEEDMKQKVIDAYVASVENQKQILSNRPPPELPTSNINNRDANEPFNKNILSVKENNNTNINSINNDFLKSSNNIISSVKQNDNSYVEANNNQLKSENNNSDAIEQSNNNLFQKKEIDSSTKLNKENLHLQNVLRELFNSIIDSNLKRDEKQKKLTIFEDTFKPYKIKLSKILIDYFDFKQLEAGSIEFNEAFENDIPDFISTLFDTFYIFKEGNYSKEKKEKLEIVIDAIPYLLQNDKNSNSLSSSNIDNQNNDSTAFERKKIDNSILKTELEENTFLTLQDVFKSMLNSETPLDDKKENLKVLTENLKDTEYLENFNKILPEYFDLKQLETDVIQFKKYEKNIPDFLFDIINTYFIQGEGKYPEEKEKNLKIVLDATPYLLKNDIDNNPRSGGGKKSRKYKKSRKINKSRKTKKTKKSRK